MKEKPHLQYQTSMVITEKSLTLSVRQTDKACHTFFISAFNKDTKVICASAGFTLHLLNYSVSSSSLGSQVLCDQFRLLSLGNCLKKIT